MSKKFIILIILVSILSIAFLQLYSSESDSTNVSIVSNASVISTLQVEIADNTIERYNGLSNKKKLNNSSGMLFIFEDSSERTFVMRDMDFGIDIIFIDENCQITEIHNAEKPSENETGEEEKHQYTGYGKYVLEVPYNYTNNKIGVGDKININKSYTDKC